MDKARERRLIETFLACRGLSGVAVQDHEEPDFLVEVDGGLVGIEVTDLIEATPRQPVPPQQWAAEGRRLVRAAQEVFEQANRQPVVVELSFTPQLPAREFRDLALPRQLAAAVEEHLLHQANGSWTLGPFRRDPVPQLTSLYAAPLGASPSEWRLGSMTQVRPASCDDLVATVAGKEPLVPKYRRACPVAWLLVNCDLVGQEVTLAVPDLPCLVSTAFDRVFCIDFYGAVREAACAKAA
jgi:hypothetical protein